MESDKITIIRKKKKIMGHGGHHGGAWKVAYADFVTAMMAFFLVMWLMGADEEVKQSVSAYFKDPAMARDGKDATGPFGGGDASGKSQGSNGRFEESTLDKPTYAPPVKLEEYAVLKDLSTYYEGSAFTAEVEGEFVKYEITPRVIFDVNSAEIPNNIESRTLLLRLIDAFKQHDGTIVVEGYADENQDWALAFARALAVKNVLVGSGVKDEKIIPVAGHRLNDDGRVRSVDLSDTGTVRFILKRIRR